MATEQEFSLEGMSVLIAVPCYRGVLPVDTVAALLQTQAVLKNMGVKVGFLWERENAIIDFCRNRMVDRFMKDSDYQKILFLDDDIVFKPDDVIRLLAFGTKHKIVAATYPVRKLEPTFYVDFKDGSLEKPCFSELGLVKIKGCGMGFCLVDRTVFEALWGRVEQYNDKGRTISRYFKVDVQDNTPVGEDMYFFRLWDRYDGETWLDPSIELKHVGNHAFDYSFKAALQQAMNRTD